VKEKQIGLFTLGAAEKPLMNLGSIIKNQGSPTFRDRKPLPLVERTGMSGLDATMPPGTPLYEFTLGECTVIITHDGGTYGWHLSIAHHYRYPMWDEIAEARYRLLPPDINMAILLPPEEEWINIHKNCFQMIQIPEPSTTVVVGDVKSGTEPLPQDQSS
jgi:hypothetical protein